LNGLPAGQQRDSGLFVGRYRRLGVLNGLPAGQQRDSGLFVGRDKSLPVLQNVLTGCGAHPAYCTMHIKDYFSGIM
jgi:hypothetical protein